MIEHSTVEPDASVGPMSHLRGGAHLHSGANVGNFAEVKRERTRYPDLESIRRYRQRKAEQAKEARNAAA